MFLDNQDDDNDDDDDRNKRMLFSKYDYEKFGINTKIKDDQDTWLFLDDMIRSYNEKYMKDIFSKYHHQNLGEFNIIY